MRKKSIQRQCPNCKMMMGSNTALTSHLSGDSCWGDSVPILNEETKGIWAYWSRKRYPAGNAVGVEFLLSATEMVKLFDDAGITAKDIGRNWNLYQLARYNDTGNYEVGNCRFTTMRENQQEKKTPDQYAATMSQPTSKRTHTPQGSFNSLNEASRETNIKLGTLADRVKSDREEWKEYYYV